ncbi:MAG: hypothetical protein AAFY37_01930 [Pseudomonadota bacterium]
MTEDVIYPDGITPELLMAYADGQLGPADARRVDAAIAADPALAAEVDAYRLTADCLAGAFEAPLDKPVPAHLEALVMGGAAEGRNVTSLHAARVRITPGPSFWGQAVAACAVFAFGAAFGSAALNSPAPAAGDILVAGQLDAASPIAHALETTASAEIVDIPGGRFDVVATIPVAGGATCREFETSGDGGAVVGIACRRDGGWTVEVLLHADADAGPEDGFQLASGFDADVIDTVLTGLGADMSVDAATETCLIENGWNSAACGVTGE